MFQVLIESGARHGPRRAPWTVGSVIAHGALIATAVAITMRNGLVPDERGAALPALVYVSPAVSHPRSQTASPAAGSPSALPRLPTIPLPQIPRVDAIGAVPLPVASTEAFGPGLTIRDGGGTSAPPNGVYTDRLVDRPVSARDNGSPDYPGALRVAGLEGEVTVRFVVDSTGRVEPASIAIATATHPLFSEAVRRWLLRTRYVPADVGGKAVRQLVEQRVSFTLRR